MKNKIIVIITTMSILIGILSLFCNLTFAVEYIDNPYQRAELYSVEIQDGNVAFCGRWFGDADKDIEITMIDADGQKSSVKGRPYSSDGSFILTITSSGYKAYSTEISGEEGKAEFFFDFSGISNLFSANGSFKIESLLLTHNRFFVKGYHNAANSRSISLKALYKDNTGAEAIAALKQAASDENGNFEIEFNMLPSEIQLQLMGKELEMATYDCKMPTREDLIVNEEDNDALITKFNNMLSILDEQAELCEERCISTDYEDINREVIRKFISNIQTEIDNNATARLGQYDYALTKLYLEAYESMNSYLNGEREAYDVPEYVSGEISINGTSIIGNVNSADENKKSAVFFTGFSGWDSVAEEIPFLSKIGFNSIQTELKMYDVLVRDNVDFWGVRTSNEPEIMFNTVTNTAKTGDCGLHINAMDSTPENSYKYIFQKINVKPDTTYKYGLWGKGDINVKNAIHINLNGLVGTGRKYFTSSDDWTKYDFTYKTAKDQTEVTMVILAEGYGKTDDIADFYIDDVYLVEQGTDINLVSNNSFEEKKSQNELDEEAGKLGMHINYERLEWLRDILSSAEENGVMVDIGVSPYYLPYYIRNIEGVEDGGRGFTNYSLTDQNVRNVISLWVKLLVSVAEDYESVKTLCLMGEPEVHANLTNHYDDEWMDFLENRYKTINELNKVYDTEYTAFSQVQIPRDYKSDGSIGTDVYKIYATAVYRDYVDFNDEILENFVEWFANEVKSVNQDLLLHVKFMEYFRNDYRRYHNQGTNWEKLSQHLDINGCDAHSYYEHKAETPMTLKMANYDFMTSVKNVPVLDSESHIIDDPPIVLENGEKTPVYSDKIRRYIGAEIWNGAIHGGTIRQYWIWDTHHMSMPWGSRNNQNSNFALRPEELAAMGKVSKDLMRLSKEVSLLQNAGRDTAIMYSRINAGYSENTRLNPYMQSIQRAYEELISSGQRVGFIVDSAPLDIHKYKLIVITDTTHISKDVLNEIKKFLENGGKVLLQNSSLLYDEYGKEHNRELVELIKEKAVVNEDISDTIEELELSEVELIDVATGKYPTGVEWFYTLKNGKYLVNVMNYDEEKAVELKIYLNGKEVSDTYELRSGVKTEGFIAKPMSPALLSFGDNTFELIDDKGEVIESNLTELEEGIIRCNMPASGTKILSLYKGDILINISINEDTIKFVPEDEGSYRLMAADWSMSTMSPWAESRNIRTEVKK